MMVRPARIAVFCLLFGVVALLSTALNGLDAAPINDNNNNNNKLGDLKRPTEDEDGIPKGRRIPFNSTIMKIRRSAAPLRLRIPGTWHEDYRVSYLPSGEALLSYKLTTRLSPAEVAEFQAFSRDHHKNGNGPESLWAVILRTLGRRT